MKEPGAKDEQEKTERDSRRKSVREEMLRMLDGDEALQEQMLMAIKEKALNGDLKTIEFILSVIGEKPGDKLKDADQGTVRIVLGPGVEELAK